MTRTVLIVPRAPVIELEGQLGEPCHEIVLAPWPAGITMERGFQHYAREHLVANNASRDKLRRFGYVARELLNVIDPQRDIETIERTEGRTYTDRRLLTGIKPSTVRRELSLLTAVCNHEKNEGRTKHEFKIWKPTPGPSRVRVLDRDEERRLMLVPKPMRIQLFLLLAFNTGARARAIEELTWDRVDLERRTIDYRVPGVLYGKKRRVVVPINDYLLRRLTAAYERRTDEYVIGLGERGACSTTYHLVKECYRAIGIDEEGVCRHVARHTFVTRLLRARVPIAEVARLAGDTVEMIERVYAHYLPEDLMPAVNMLCAVNAL